MIEFRAIDVSDAASVETAVRFRRDSFVCSFGDDQRFDERQYVTWLKAKLARDPQLAIHVFHDGALIGQLELGTFVPAPWIGYVNLYYLAPSSRGSGLAPELDAYVAQALRARGFARASLRQHQQRPGAAVLRTARLERSGAPFRNARRAAAREGALSTGTTGPDA